MKKKRRKLKKEGMLGGFRQVGTMVQSRVNTIADVCVEGQCSQASSVSEIGRDRSKGNCRRNNRLSTLLPQRVEACVVGGSPVSFFTESQ